MYFFYMSFFANKDRVMPYVFPSVRIMTEA